LSDNVYRNLYAQRRFEEVVNKHLIFKCGVLSYVELRLINVKCLTLLCIKHVIERLFGSVFGHLLYRYSNVASYNFFVVETSTNCFSRPGWPSHADKMACVSLLFTTSERNLAFGMER